MKKIIFGLVLSLLLVSNSWSATGWLKSKPASGDNPTTISTSIPENNAALDLMLSTYSNCKITYTSASEISVSAGGVMVSNSTGAVRLMLANTSATSVTFSNIDTGAEEASTTYYVYAVGSDTTDTEFTVKLSKSATSPTGATYYLRIGSFYNDASGNISLISNDNGLAELGALVSKSADTTYQAFTDGFVTAYTAEKEDSFSIYGYTDSSSAPTTLVAHSKVRPYGTSGSACIFFPVKKGDYWKVTLSNVTIGAIYWMPLD